MCKYSALTARCHHGVTATRNDQASGTLAAHSHQPFHFHIREKQLARQHNFRDKNAGIAGQNNMSEWNTEDTAGDREKSEDCIDYDIRLRHGVPVIVRVHHITDLYNWTPCVSVSVVWSVKGRPVIFSGGLAARRMNDDKCPAFIIRNYAGTQVTSSSWSAHY